MKVSAVEIAGTKPLHGELPVRTSRKIEKMIIKTLK